MLLRTSRVLLEEAGGVYSSMIHACIRLKSDSFAFLIMPLQFIAILEISGMVMGVYPPLAPHPTYEQPVFVYMDYFWIARYTPGTPKVEEFSALSPQCVRCPEVVIRQIQAALPLD
jgi:hypothetical protein